DPPGWFFNLNDRGTVIGPNRQHDGLVRQFAQIGDQWRRERDQINARECRKTQGKCFAAETVISRRVILLHERAVDERPQIPMRLAQGKVRRRRKLRKGGVASKSPERAQYG